MNPSAEIVIIGGGGHALSVMEMLPAEVKAAGYVDRTPVDGMPLPYLGTDDDFIRSVKEHDASRRRKIHVAVVSGTGADMEMRRRIIGLYSGFEAATLMAPTAIVTPGSSLGCGCAVMHGAIVNGASVGDFCIINTGAVIEHGVTLGRNVFIGPGAVICGGVSVGDDVFIGAGATVRNCVDIAGGTTIGMGATVTCNICETGVYTGTPARKMNSK